MSAFQLINPNQPVVWNRSNKFLLRTLVAFFVLFTVPLDWKFFRDIASLDWSGLNYTVFFEVSRYFPRILSDVPVLGDVFLILFLSLVVAGLWQRFEKHSLDFDRVYYLLFVVVRYRLSFSLAAYALLKVFPILAPYPSLTLLNTPYGDISAWKIFNLSLGIVPDYQAFLGFWELLAAILLLNRKTASIGGFIAVLFLGNVAMSNLAYEGGEFVYSGVLTLYALFVFAHDLPKYYSLLFLRNKTMPSHFDPTWISFGGFRKPQYVKAGFILIFFVVYSVQVFNGHRNGIGKFPTIEGVSGLEGVYDVSFFVLGSDTLAYGEYHPARWEKVVFEKWATVSIRAGEFAYVNSANTEKIPVADNSRNFEAEGIKGWGIFSYGQLDGQVIHLQPKSDATAHLEFSYTLLDESGRLKLQGSDGEGRDFTAILEPLERKYLIQEAFKTGRRSKLIL